MRELQQGYVDHRTGVADYNRRSSAFEQRRDAYNRTRITLAADFTNWKQRAEMAQQKQLAKAQEDARKAATDRQNQELRKVRDEARKAEEERRRLEKAFDKGSPESSGKASSGGSATTRRPTAEPAGAAKTPKEEKRRMDDSMSGSKQGKPGSTPLPTKPSAPGTGGLAGASSPGSATQSPKADPGSVFYVQYTYYAKHPDGKVQKISSGQAGPFSTRKEASTTCDWYNSQDQHIRDVVYYYQAKVTP